LVTVEQNSERDAVTEIERLRRALQKIADLPVEKFPGAKFDPNLRARRIAIAALGGDPESADHEKFYLVKGTPS
jgi:hypothetical protein